ncbi:MAG: hypothetical protein QW140_01230, partial [Candidatus Aenigmatarchaeota archaeon]
IRVVVQQYIIKCLESIETPVSIEALRKQISKNLGKSLSWNTVQKYLQELVELGRVEAIPTPHSKREGEGLTVYILKR